MHFVLPSPSVQKPAASTFISHQNVPKPLMVLSSHAGHVSGFVGQAFLHLLFFFLHLVPLNDLHWVNASSQLASHSAKVTHGDGEAAGGEGGRGDVTVTGEGGGGAATGAGSGALGGGTATGEGGGGLGGGSGGGEGAVEGIEGDGAGGGGEGGDGGEGGEGGMDVEL